MCEWFSIFNEQAKNQKNVFTQVWPRGIVWPLKSHESRICFPASGVCYWSIRYVGIMACGHCHPWLYTRGHSYLVLPDFLCDLVLFCCHLWKLPFDNNMHTYTISEYHPYVRDFNTFEYERAKLSNIDDTIMRVVLRDRRGKGIFSFSIAKFSILAYTNNYQKEIQIGYLRKEKIK